MIRLLVLRAAALVAAAASLSAAPAPASPADPSMASPPHTTLTGYLGPKALDSVAILGPPPAPDSARGQADRAIYLESRALAGTPRWKEAQRDNDLWYGGALHRYACALGVDLGRRTPATLKLMQRVELDTRTVGTPAKRLYNRVRPPIGDDQPICIPREDWLKTNGSYPSGHANVGWAWGLILAEIAPSKASELVAAGREIGESRIVCGVHYPSDVEAGRKLGAALVARLHAELQFRRDLMAAKTELARAKARPMHCAA